MSVVPPDVHKALGSLPREAIQYERRGNQIQSIVEGKLPDEIDMKVAQLDVHEDIPDAGDVNVTLPDVDEDSARDVNVPEIEGEAHPFVETGRDDDVQHRGEGDDAGHFVETGRDDDVQHRGEGDDAGHERGVEVVHHDEEGVPVHHEGTLLREGPYIESLEPQNYDLLDVMKQGKKKEEFPSKRKLLKFTLTKD